MYKEEMNYECEMRREYYSSYISESGSSSSSSNGNGNEIEEMGIKKGPWTEEEDAVLANYITLHGEGHWNALARSAGLKRTGKSCRLRWLNYLRPNVRRGNITLQEQLLILDLHSRWGNRWSRIAQELPGRTDNEIKNYWRTRVVKQAKQLKCDVNSKQFRDALRFVWIPRLLERIQSSNHNINNTHHHHHHIQSADDNISTTTSAISQQQNMVQYSQLQPFEFEPTNDLWTDENICFLQQQLADDSLYSSQFI